MTGDQELLRVAELVRLCAITTSLIAKVQPVEDKEQLDRLSRLSFQVAEGLEKIVTRAEKKSDGADRG